MAEAQIHTESHPFKRVYMVIEKDHAEILGTGAPVMSGNVLSQIPCAARAIRQRLEIRVDAPDIGARACLLDEPSPESAPDPAFDHHARVEISQHKPEKEHVYGGHAPLVVPDRTSLVKSGKVLQPSH